MLVVDTNQVGLLPAPGRRFPNEIILAPPILAEVLVRQPQGRTRDLTSLSRYRITLGKELFLVGRELGQQTPREIACYRPFYGRQSTIARALDRLLQTPANPSQGWLDWAQEQKRQHTALMTNISNSTAALRQRLREAHAGHATNWAEVVDMTESADSYIGGVTASWVGSAGLNQQARQRMHDAVLANTYSRRFLYGVLYWSICISRGWTTQTWNRDPQATRDDWSDVTLSLYVGNPDRVVSNDNFVRQMFSSISPDTDVLRANQL